LIKGAVKLIHHRAEKNLNISEISARQGLRDK